MASEFQDYTYVIDKIPDGGKQHKKMLELYNNLVAYISHIEHWKSTALQLAKNYGVRIHSLEQRIEELEQERRWIPVSERLPKHDEMVLGFKNGKVTTGFFLGASHWQPLPQPPKDGE